MKPKKSRHDLPREGAQRFTAIVDIKTVQELKRFCEREQIPITSFVSDALKYWLEVGKGNYSPE